MDQDEWPKAATGEVKEDPEGQTGEDGGKDGRLAGVGVTEAEWSSVFYPTSEFSLVGGPVRGELVVTVPLSRG